MPSNSVRCACPNCRHPFFIPPEFVGRKATCRKCRTPLIVKETGGTIVLALAGLPGDGLCKAPPAATPAKKKTNDAVLSPYQQKRSTALICAAIALVLIVCSGGIGGIAWSIVKVKNNSRPTESVEDERIENRELDSDNSSPKAVNQSDSILQPAAAAASSPPRPQQKAKEPDVLDRDEKSNSTFTLEAPKPVPEGPIEVETFQTLVWAYRENPIAAAKKYDGKRVRIRVYRDPAEKIDKRDKSFWLVEAIGQRTEGAVYRGPALVGGTIVPVYGIEYQLSKEGEEQYAKLKKEERQGMELVGTVKGTRPYPANVFDGTMLQLVDCSFVPKSPARADAESSKGKTPPATEQNDLEKRLRATGPPKRTAPSGEEAKRILEEQKRRKAEYKAAVEDAKAKRELRGALSLLDRGFKEQAKKHLQEIIDKYPDTPTAKAAKRKLDELAE